MSRLLMAIDPGSTSCGVAIFDLDNGDLVDSACFKADGYHSWGSRFQDIVKQYKATLKDYAKDVTEICYERNSTHGNDILTMVVGLMVVFCPRAKMTQKKCGVPPTTWKAWVRRKSGVRGEVKGCDGLELVRPGWVDTYDLGEDEADACLIGLAWMQKNNLLPEDE